MVVSSHAFREQTEIAMKIKQIDRLQAAFEQAADLNGRERDDYLAELHRNAPELAAEVQSLLGFHARVGDPLEEICEAHRKVVDLSQTRDQPRLPKVAGYQVERSIGTGGQADVYLARQASTGQKVAIKVFRVLGLADAQRHRIDAETEALARLQLPNVVPILDRGQTADGHEYLITRFIDGVPVDQAASKLLAGDCQRVLELFAKISEALARVHRHGIIHRDLKPSNIFVDHDNEPYLLDFGLASFIADPSGRLLTATPADAFQGSILWACPEQVDASFGSVDQRSDIYSLGVVLYQSLTGRFPYSVEGGILAVAQQVVQARPDAMNSSSAAKETTISSEVQSIVLRTLEKRPGRRFQSADELATALTTAGRTSSSGQPTQPKPLKRLTAIPLLGIAGVLLFAGVFLAAGHLNVVDSPMEADTTPNASAAAIDAPSENLVLPERPLITVSSFDDTLLPFGETPTNWKQVTDFQNNHHEIERADILVAGDFILKLNVSAHPAERSGFALNLIGEGGGADLRIIATKTNTWSDNETWEIGTPAGTTRKGLPIDVHTFTLERHGEKMTLRADAVYRPERNSPVLATFATKSSDRFDAIRLSTTGPAMRLERLRLAARDTDSHATENASQ